FFIESLFIHFILNSFPTRRSSDLKFLGAIVVVSHDRTFLDQLCTEIWEIEDGSITIYKGNYSEYANQKTLERQQHQEAFEKFERSEEHTSELQSRFDIVCRLLLEK